MHMSKTPMSGDQQARNKHPLYTNSETFNLESEFMDSETIYNAHVCTKGRVNWAANRDKPTIMRGFFAYARK